MKFTRHCACVHIYRKDDIFMQRRLKQIFTWKDLHNAEDRTRRWTYYALRYFYHQHDTNDTSEKFSFHIQHQSNDKTKTSREWPLRRSENQKSCQSFLQRSDKSAVAYQWKNKKNEIEIRAGVVCLKCPRRGITKKI